jgi:hypothetical protein
MKILGRPFTTIPLLIAAVSVVRHRPVGNTNVPEFLMAYETNNALDGKTSNPWDVARTAGGSSGGEAAAIAAGCSAGGVGSDGGGSVLNLRDLHPHAWDVSACWF